MEKKVRLFEKKAINYSQLATVFGLTRQTLSTRFKNLIKMGLVAEYNDIYYELPTIEEKEAMLIPFQTLKILTDTLSENAISTYAYLFNRWYAND